MTRTVPALMFACLLIATPAFTQSTYPAPVDGDFVARDYLFTSSSCCRLPTPPAGTARTRFRRSGAGNW